MPLPLRHASVWLYNAVGLAGGDGTNPLSQFYFGGFGNNYVDDGEVKRYREFGSASRASNRRTGGPPLRQVAAGVQPAAAALLRTSAARASS